MVIATSYAIIVSTYMYPIAVYIITTMTSTYFKTTAYVLIKSTITDVCLMISIMYMNDTRGQEGVTWQSATYTKSLKAC